MKKYFLRVFGCQMNFSDAEKVMGWYEEKGYKLADKVEEADEVVIVSCSVREAAENRVFGLVNNLKKIKDPSFASQDQKASAGRQNSKIKNKTNKPKVILTGCMLRFPIGVLKKKLPAVDEFKKISEYKINSQSVDSKIRKSQTQALVKIMEGCNNFCSYCVVPYARGREISRPIKEIVCEVEELARRGYKEITLLGQNVNSYRSEKSKVKNPSFASQDQKASAGRQNSKIGKEVNKFQTPFANLLVTLNEISGIEKISFLTSNPWDLNNEIIEAMSLEKIDRYLHLPVQSGDDEILKQMNRQYSAKDYLRLVEKIKCKIPDIQIGTDIIVGFPGETEEQFENTVSLCKKVGFVKAYVSIYSPRQQTAAYKMKEQIPFKEKRRRWKILDNLINHK